MLVQCLVQGPGARAGVSRSVRSLAVRAEISYVMVKPDGVQRGLVGEIISRFERKGFKLVGLKLYQTPKEVAEEHYKELSSKPFYPKLVEYIVSGPVVAMVSWHLQLLISCCLLAGWAAGHAREQQQQQQGGGKRQWMFCPLSLLVKPSVLNASCAGVGGQWCCCFST